MTNLEAALIAVGVGFGVYFVATKLRSAALTPTGDPSIDPTTGGVKLPTPAVYGPPAPITDSNSFIQ